MKKNNQKIFVIGFVLFIILQVHTAYASPATGGPAWQATESYVNLMNFTAISSPAPSDLFVYDYSEGIADKLKVFSQGESTMFTSLAVTTDDQTGFVTLSKNQSESIVLETSSFGFLFGDRLDYSFVELTGAVDTFQITDDPNSWDVLVTGASPVPVPAAAWLLGSGLVGLIGLRRKRESFK